MVEPGDCLAHLPVGKTEFALNLLIMHAFLPECLYLLCPCPLFGLHKLAVFIDPSPPFFDRRECIFCFQLPVELTDTFSRHAQRLCQFAQRYWRMWPIFQGVL